MDKLMAVVPKHVQIIKGGVGLVQLSKLEKFVQQGQYWADFYRRHFTELERINLPVFPYIGQHTSQASVLRFISENTPYTRNQTMALLRIKGISTRHGRYAIHLLAYYQDRYKFESNVFPEAMLCNIQTTAFPLYNRMTNSNFHYVVDAIENLG